MSRKSNGDCKYCGKYFENTRAIGAHVANEHRSKEDKEEKNRKIKR